MQAAGADHQGDWTDGQRKEKTSLNPAPGHRGIWVLAPWAAAPTRLLSGQWPQEGLCVPQPPGPADGPLLRHRRWTWPWGNESKERMLRRKMQDQPGDGPAGEDWEAGPQQGQEEQADSELTGAWRQTTENSPPSRSGPGPMWINTAKADGTLS